MNAQEVFRKMKVYHDLTGQVMTGGRFVLNIASRYPQKDVVEGLLLFDKYLDECRREVI